jgi:hypothetical protein
MENYRVIVSIVKFFIVLNRLRKLKNQGFKSLQKKKKKKKKIKGTMTLEQNVNCF